jgi:hypothetical protein
MKRKTAGTRNRSGCIFKTRRDGGATLLFIFHSSSLIKSKLQNAFPNFKCDANCLWNSGGEKKFLKLLENRNIRKWNPAGIQPAKIALRREHSAEHTCLRLSLRC